MNTEPVFAGDCINWFILWLGHDIFKNIVDLGPRVSMSLDYITRIFLFQALEGQRYDIYLWICNWFLGMCTIRL